jgi:hypothetical protein
MGTPRIPHSTPQQTFVCWGCQDTKPNTDQMQLDPESPIPVCGHCWAAMPISERIKHAQAFSDRAKGGIIAEFNALIASSFASFVEQRGPDWMRGGGN